MIFILKNSGLRAIFYGEIILKADIIFIPINIFMKKLCLVIIRLVYLVFHICLKISHILFPLKNHKRLLMLS
ncbi:hypothetical protein DOX71_11460 [Cronobacter sakazakii]|nr:hypothetical protein [Cronobacter sakazakii]EGT5696231.1 hypothetical protein [Cronobacter sakazakii]EGT5719856.1 hypothetical protein [Cronobacter sakazakii]EGT5723292.1 hypothetical protein [Cronobacter sakazakii]PPY49429.1 hypothetical protein C3D79_08220 [Cronobacter sakazakii]